MRAVQLDAVEAGALRARPRRRRTARSRARGPRRSRAAASRTPAVLVPGARAPHLLAGQLRRRAHAAVEQLHDRRGARARAAAPRAARARAGRRRDRCRARRPTPCRRARRTPRTSRSRPNPPSARRASQASSSSPSRPSGRRLEVRHRREPDPVRDRQPRAQGHRFEQHAPTLPPGASRVSHVAARDEPRVAVYRAAMRMRAVSIVAGMVIGWLGGARGARRAGAHPRPRAAACTRTAGAARAARADDARAGRHRRPRGSIAPPTRASTSTRYACGGFLKTARDPAGSLELGRDPDRRQGERGASSAACSRRPRPRSPAPSDRRQARRLLRRVHGRGRDRTRRDRADPAACSTSSPSVTDGKTAARRDRRAARRRRCSPFFGIGPQQDFGDATQVIASIDQAGLGLPDRKYYLENKGTMAKTRAAYRRARRAHVRARSAATPPRRRRPPPPT